MPVKLLNCTCEHSEQDKLHGKDKRVYNQGGGTKTIKYRCTVCSKESGGNVISTIITKNKK